MKSILWVLMLSLGVFVFSACSGADYRANSNGGNSNTGVKPEKDLTASITEVENNFYAAWKKKDGKFFEENLTDNFVGVGGEGRNGKESVAKSIAGFPCDVKSTSTADEAAIEVAEGVVVFTAKDTSVVECDGKAMPNPLWAATVYVKDGDKWKAAFHQTAPAADTKGEAPKMPDAPKPAPLEDKNKEITAKLAETEKGLWEAWKKKDTKPFEEALADNFFELGANGRADRAGAIKGITEHKCEVKSHSLSDFHTSKVSDEFYLVSYKGTMDGTCDGNPAPKGMWSSTLVKKDGEDWKAVFHISSPAG